jgi:thioesterase domain-containing protein
MTTLYPGGVPHALEAATAAEDRPAAAVPARSDLLRQLHRTMRSEIPLTRAIGIRAVAFDRAGLSLSAPLARNINDKGTVFSGSLNAAATLAGWGLIWLLLRDQLLNGAIVIQDSAIKYLQPVRRDFVARGLMPEPIEIDQLHSTLRRHNRARILVQAQIWEQDALRVTFSGRYVVDLNQPG